MKYYDDVISYMNPSFAIETDIKEVLKNEMQ